MHVKPRQYNFVCKKLKKLKKCLEKLIADWLTKLGNLLAGYAKVISFKLKVLKNESRQFSIVNSHVFI